jgi:triphosphoribosyl-dephospho-CoA synthase
VTKVISCRALGAADVASAAQLACLLEASAPKPGNVSPGRHFADARYEDFLASAVAIGAPLGGAGTRSVGATVRLAVEATARWTRSNTNLGIVLLLAPIARAALGEKGDGSHFPGPEEVLKRGERPVFPPEAEGQNTRDGYLLPGPRMRPVPFSGTLREAVRRVLDETTVEDARETYAAIRSAAPGGLGQLETEDVANEPTITLLDAMRLAADRDAVARIRDRVRDHIRDRRAGPRPGPPGRTLLG